VLKRPNLKSLVALLSNVLTGTNAQFFLQTLQTRQERNTCPQFLQLLEPRELEQAELELPELELPELELSELELPELELPELELPELMCREYYSEIFP